MHFVFTGIAYFFKQDVKIERIYDHGRRLVFYGIAGMLVCLWLSNFEYELFAVWGLSRSLRMGFANFELCPPQYGFDALGEGELSKYWSGMLLSDNCSMVLRNCILLHIQCP